MCLSVAAPACKPFPNASASVVYKQNTKYEIKSKTKLKIHLVLKSMCHNCMYVLNI